MDFKCETNKINLLKNKEKRKKKFYLVHHFPKQSGLIGLTNLGNTCYMNAALQALSNCPQLKHYMLENISKITKPGLSKSFAFLLYEIWTQSEKLYISNKLDEKKLYDYVSPIKVLQGVRTTCHNFRFYAQQEDVQEFLRCFLDQIHEELKYPQKNLESASNNINFINKNDNKQETLLESNFDKKNLIDYEQNLYNNSLKKGENNFILEGGDDFDNLNENLNYFHNKKQDKDLIYESIISKLFDGQILNSVQCLTCKNVSTIQETFQDLSLPIPNQNSSKETRFMSEKYQKRNFSKMKHSSNEIKFKFNLEENNLIDRTKIRKSKYLTYASKKKLFLYNFFKLIIFLHNLLKTSFFYFLFLIFNWLQKYLYGPKISLEDCLEAFFSTDELKGNNMYKCEKCKKLRNGIKYMNLIVLPEILCIHLKRFRNEMMFSSKISSYISFPIKELSMKKYMLKINEKDLKRKGLFNNLIQLNLDNHDNNLSNNITNEYDYVDINFIANNSSILTKSKDSLIKYPSLNRNVDFNCNYNNILKLYEQEISNSHLFDLVSVICHKGRCNSGHYITYALNSLDNNWYEFDDTCVRKVEESEVANCEAYVLFYKKSKKIDVNNDSNDYESEDNESYQSEDEPLLSKNSRNWNDLYNKNQLIFNKRKFSKSSKKERYFYKNKFDLQSNKYFDILDDIII